MIETQITNMREMGGVRREENRERKWRKQKQIGKQMKFKTNKEKDGRKNY